MGAFLHGSIRAQRSDVFERKRFGFFVEPIAHPTARRRQTAAIQRRRRNARVTIFGRRDEKSRRAAKKLLHRVAIAIMSRPPNFARACGRVPVGGHPDKRPDSRPERTPSLKSRPPELRTT